MSDNAKNQIKDLNQTTVLELLPNFPIVLVSVAENVITVNQIHYFSFSPLRIGIGIAYERYSYDLIKEKSEFIINIPQEEQIEAVKKCGKISGENNDKFKLCDLSKEKSINCDSFTIKEIGASIECKVEREIEFENRSWFVGKVVAAQKSKDHDSDKSLLCGRHNYQHQVGLLQRDNFNSANCYVVK